MEKENPSSFFRFSFRATLSFTLMNALVYVDIDQGIHKGKMKVALNEKRKKLCGFSFSINIANFEAFLSVFKLSKKPLFLKSVHIGTCHVVGLSSFLIFITKNIFGDCETGQNQQRNSKTDLKI